MAKEMMGNIDKAISKYESNIERLKEIEGIQNDLNHEISLGKKRNVVDGYKIYNRLRELLIERYEVRDENDILKPMYEFLKNKNLKPDLNRINASMIKEEERLKSRKYNPKVLNSVELSMEISDNNVGNKPFEDLLKDYKDNYKGM